MKARISGKPLANYARLDREKQILILGTAICNASFFPQPESDEELLDRVGATRKTAMSPSGERNMVRGKIWHWLTEPATSVVEPDHRRRAQLLSSLLVFLILLGSLFITMQVLTVPDFMPTFQVIMGGICVLAVAYGLSRTKHYKIGAAITASIPLIASLANAAANPNDTIALAFSTVSVLLSSMLLNRRSTVILSAASAVLVALVPIFVPALSFPTVLGPLSFVVVVSALVVVSMRHRDLLEIDRQEQLKAVLESTDDGILLLDSGGRLLVANPRAQELLGFEAENYLGRHFMRFVETMEKRHGPMAMGYSRETINDVRRKIQDKPDAVVRRSYSVEWPQNRVLDEVSTPVLSHDGGVVGRLVVLHDITGQRAAENFREEFTHMLVHDLRSPLAGIIASLYMAYDIVGEAEPEPADLRDTLNISRDNAEAMLRLVETLLDVHHLETGEMPLNVTAFKLDEAARQAQITLKSLADIAGIEVSISAPQKLEPVMADELKIQRVIINLLDNALRHTPRNGKVRIVVSSNGDNQRVSVVDTGMGIPEEDRERVFERFARGVKASEQKSRRGWGLGLTFCKMTVEAHGGSIWVDSGDDEGAVFHFTLPQSGKTQISK
jgi:PAS domain S-box-containing protein